MCSILKLVFIAFVICVANANLVHKHKHNPFRYRNFAKRDSACNKILSESRWFEYGFDATELDIHKCPEMGGKRQQIFVINDCSNGEQWKNNYINDTLDVPNNIHIYDLKSDIEVQKHFAEFHAYADHLASDVGINHEQEHGLFSQSDEYLTLQTKLAKNSLVVIQKRTILYRIAFNVPSEMKFSDNFTEMSKNLPPDFKFNPPKYIEFIKTFGTHYLSSAGFGGTIRRLQLFKNSKDVKSKSPVALISTAYKGFPTLSSSDKQECKDSTMNLTYKYMGSNYEQQYFGVYPDEAEFSGEKWNTAVAKHPYAVTVELQSISKLFKDEQAIEVEKAVKAYMAKAYLDESVRKLKIQLSIGLPKTNYTDDYLEQYETINKTNNYDYNEIRELTSKIRFEARQPVADGLVVDNGNGLYPNSFITCSLIIFALVKIIAFA